MNIIETLKNKYQLAPNSYLKENVWLVKHKESDFSDSRAEWNKLQEKWQSRYAPGHYGLQGMTDRMPIVFYKVIDEFLDWVLVNNPDFQIAQVKQKFSNIRILLDNIDDKTKNYCWRLETLLMDHNIKY